MLVYDEPGRGREWRREVDVIAAMRPPGLPECMPSAVAGFDGALGDYFGGAVNLAARLLGLAPGR